MERHTCRPDVSPLKQMIMKRVKHLLLASCLLPTFLGAQGVASASFLEITPEDRKSTRLNSSHNRESRMPSSA